VLEKVHGANFCFIVNEAEVVAARRMAVLQAQDCFYNWQKTLKKHEAALQDLFRRVRAMRGFTDTTEYDTHMPRYLNSTCDADVCFGRVCVFGELFGGCYPHPDVAPKNVPKVQDGVYYSPDIDFFAFDVQAVHGNERRSWLDFDRATELFRACGLMHAEPLMEGTLDQCLAFDIRINSTIPAKLGLPPIERNQMEGVVVKAVKAVYILKIDSGEPYLERAIYKKKNAQFDEVNPRGDHNGSSTGNRKQRRPDAIAQEMERYINVNRLHSVESKMGPVTSDNAQTAARALAEDAVADFIADHPDLWAGLDQRGRELRRKHFQAHVTDWLNHQLQDTRTESSS
jgi:Rnl2 family RNA ligase